ncbi:BQ5605_C009g05640 [Microbotryum silenes-dioicae]|uniref:BQ5605_C009g05640 protein n=1 Tax=Microbotryum silenes-dioicae TaxID=796604 RepID=A0A2X0PF37_9BASI|nr:BQ5605_C009g05640 [Microbotryum silenes-dioicae]
MSVINEHPLAASPAFVPFPSPPLSLSDRQADLNAFEADPAYRGGFLASSLSRNEEADPLLLKSKIQSDEHLTELRSRRKGGKVLDSFYTRQNDHITSLLKPMDKHIQEAAEEEDANRLPVSLLNFKSPSPGATRSWSAHVRAVAAGSKFMLYYLQATPTNSGLRSTCCDVQIKIAIYGSFICNCVLAILQVYAAISSLSLSFFATMIDSVFDPMANLVLLYCHRTAAKVDLVKYPSGGSKFETIGDITYSAVMGAVSVVLVAFSVQDLAKGESDKSIHVPAIIAVGIAFVTKLALFLYCYSLQSKNSQVRVLWEDHRNDLFINGFGLFTNAAGAKIAWWIDPSGALVISFMLILVWGRTIYKLFSYLAGVAAPIKFQQLVIYKAMTFAHGIEMIDSCVVYHAGPNYIVEVDIVMSSETPLWKAHDISQALQDKLEELPKVDRAFVHVDHETSHKPVSVQRLLGKSFLRR